MSAVHRCCAHCGGPVYSVRFTGKTELPAIDHRGRFIFETATDPTTGQTYERQVTISIPIQGLGTWKCSRRCKSHRIVIVTQSVATGKEHDRGSGVRGHNSWHGMDLADEALITREKIRPIAVVTTYNQEKNQ